jgi:miniconductance mechanosensitive channel
VVGTSSHYILGLKQPVISDVQQWLGVATLLVVVVLSYILARAVILPGLSRLVAKNEHALIRYVLSDEVWKRAAYLVPFAVVHLVISNANHLPKVIAPYIPSVWRSSNLDLTWWSPIETINEMVIVVLLLLVMSSLINAVNAFYLTFPVSKERPIKGYLQILKLIMFSFGGVVVLALLTGQSVGYFVTSLSAMTAVLLLIFKDTLLSLVASIQLTQTDMIRVGDWITVPGTGVDGDIIDIALHTVKIQNWDRTIATVPTAHLIQTPFNNWRGMTNSGGRRIKRSINIDMSTIRFLTNDEITAFGRFEPLRQYMAERVAEINVANRAKETDGGQEHDPRRLTNVGTLRAYIRGYLTANPRLHQTGLTLMVRQLQPGSKGLPIELYCFSNQIDWGLYEDIQSDIFDHILAMLNDFGLQVFQDPTGDDLRRLSIKETSQAGG